MFNCQRIPPNMPNMFWTQVTQFLTNNGKDDGKLKEIRRFYVQDGKAIASPPIKILPDEPDSITDKMCKDTTAA